MQIRYLNGTRLKRAFIAGAKHVIQTRDLLNRINVFPVADSDTGTNMAGTLQSMINRLLSVREVELYPVARFAAESALDGARGNSGTILAQFIYGFSEELRHEARVSTGAFSRAVRGAVDYAYRAIASPKEGTILSVLHDWAESLLERGGRTADFVELIVSSLGSAQRSLERTRNELAELRTAGVVDAGALGFVSLLEGIASFITHGRIREIESTVAEDLPDELHMAVGSIDTITYRYCTECFITGEGIEHERLRGSLEGLGDSLIVAGSPAKTKIHIHTDAPSGVFRIAYRHGFVAGEKVDDMRKQFAASHVAHGRCAVVVDSTCDLPPEVADELDIHFVYTRLTFGDRTYIDRLGITPAEFYELMKASPDVAPLTTQPPPADFRRQFEFLLAHYGSVLYLGLASTLSGTIRSALSAASMVNGDIRVFDTLSISIGAALVARRVAEAVRRGATIDEAVALAKSLFARTHLFLTVRSMDALIRSGRVGKGSGRAVDALGLKPVLCVTQQGRVTPVGAALGERQSLRALARRVRRLVPAGSRVDLAVAHADAPESARALTELLRAELARDHELFVVDAAPVLAAHTGLGTVGVAVTIP